MSNPPPTAPAPAPAPSAGATLAEVMQRLSQELEAIEAELEARRSELHAAELRRANLLGQYQAYRSIQIANPAEVDYGSE